MSKEHAKAVDMVQLIDIMGYSFGVGKKKKRQLSQFCKMKLDLSLLLRTYHMQLICNCCKIAKSWSLNPVFSHLSPEGRSVDSQFPGRLTLISLVSLQGLKNHPLFEILQSLDPD